MLDFFLLQSVGMPVEYSDTGFEHIPEADEDTIFVLDNFEGDIFIRLHRAGVRIMGPPVIIRCAQENEVGIWFDASQICYWCLGTTSFFGR